MTRVEKSTATMNAKSGARYAKLTERMQAGTANVTAQMLLDMDHGG